MPAGHVEVGFRGVAGVLPEMSWDLNELARRGLIRSEPETLADFGFERAFVASAGEAGELASRAARAALHDAQLEAAEIDLLIWASALPANHLSPAHAGEGERGGERAVLQNFQYAAGRLQNALGLVNADVLAVTQQGCATMFSALRTARAMIVAEPRMRNVLCIGVDVLPENSNREIMYNLISDAASAVVVSRDCPRNRWIGHHQISHGYYWDPLAKRAEIIAAYFPTSRAVIEELLQAFALLPRDVDVVIPTGVNRNSWEILMRLADIPGERLYRGDGRSFGHTISSDNFLLLQQLRSGNEIARGARMLLFTYGFGSTWSAILLGH
jgi:3-oxoacyl-[acyl-carrier-protein] synthase-3